MSFTETQEQILDAAMSIIVRQGIDSTSMRAVAEAADVSLGLLSYHFAGKEGLIVAAFRLSCDRLLEYTRMRTSGGGDDPAERLRGTIRAFYDGDFVTDDYLALWFAIWAVSRTNHEVHIAEQELYENYGIELARAIKDAFPAISDTEVAARTTDLIVVQNGLWLNWARFHNKVDLERGLKLCEAVARGSVRLPTDSEALP